ncbi:hypothetical protein CH306_16985 [Rhodococcus sp. 15-725-2-2b]|uniref:hypothetical protein n=1 Tax=unclassified Rhodococcus (in: high G+C Gram-positive bacteria) TaxID=192944 RepID=UPI000B9B4D8C|nr:MULTISPECIES: hypothetical protein [unclassified Rhodococcus (in: high G+C Gram-positive bacteria)]OZC67418.1 hypothetical protein CH277_14245 [Rhodococcus sp. 06-469-3-2]OZD49396.1 hypothetical protein CH264_05110 [Rhodococcus sp. 06-1477-1A]OZE71879.1 hypothetical protein CH306_16985 [Rhodococcus sp. 15-725-2-2b]
MLINRCASALAVMSAVLHLRMGVGGASGMLVTDAVSGASAASILAAVELTLAAVVVFVRTRGIPPELLHHRLQEPR